MLNKLSQIVRGLQKQLERRQGMPKENRRSSSAQRSCGGRRCRRHQRQYAGRGSRGAKEPKKEEEEEAATRGRGAGD